MTGRLQGPTRGRALRLVYCLLGVLLATGPAPAQQTAADALMLSAIARQTDPAEIIVAVEAQLAALPDTSTRATIRAEFDLNELKAQQLAAQGELARAAALYTDLGLFASDYREVLEEDPIILWRRAQAIFDSLGAPDKSLQILHLILAEERGNAAPVERIAGLFREMADYSAAAGDPAQAEKYRQDALEIEARAADPETRGLSTDNGFRTVDVFYATDRARTGETYPAEFYGSDRGALDYGRAEVTIPNSHRPGDIETPSVWRLDFGVDPARHIVLKSITPSDDAAAFFADLNATITSRGRDELFVFIHGYNVSFAQAAKRAAQLAYDMNFSGVPVLYSWPSRGTTVGYVSDTAVVRLSGRRLMGFLEGLAVRSGASTIHVIAHSMGNRALTDALELMATRRTALGQADPVFAQVIFAAPDVDAGLFLAMLPTFRPLARRMTLYASNQDWALAASRRLHGDAPRAGQGGRDIISDANIDTVDMSLLGDDMLAHSYFAQDSSALLDLVTLFWRNLTPARRCGLQALDAAAKAGAWRYIGGICQDARLLGLITALRDEQVQAPEEIRALVDLYIEDDAQAARASEALLAILNGP